MELQGPNCNVGYRQMWQIIKNKHRYNVKRLVAIITWPQKVKFVFKINSHDAHEDTESRRCRKTTQE